MRIYPSLKYFVLTLFLFTFMLVAACTKDSGLEHDTSKSKSKQIQSKEKIKLGDFILPEIETKSKAQILKLYMPNGIESGNWKDYNKAAESAMRESDYRAAEVLLNRSIQLSPSISKTYYLRGRCKYNSFEDRNSEAAIDLEKAIELGETGSGAYEILTTIYDTKGEVAKALDIIGKGIKVCTKKKHLYHARAAIYISLGEKENALKDYNALLDNSPEFARVYIMRGQLFEELGRNEEALKDYLLAFERDNKDSVVSSKSVSMKFRSKLHSKLGNHKEAVNDLNRVLAVMPKDDELLRLRGEQYLLMKDYKKAVQDFTTVIEVAPHFARLALEDRSKAYKALGEDELAKQDLERANKLKDAPAEKPVY